MLSTTELTLRTIQMRQNTQTGFTLIELLVVVAIVGLLVRIAYPSYQDSVLKSKRADAKASLSQLANWMERYYTANGCYTALVSSACVTTSTTAPTLPFTTSPQSGTANYTLSVSAVTFSTFTLTATPNTNTADPCGSLSLDSTGAKTISGTNTNYSANYCWTGVQ